MEAIRIDLQSINQTIVSNPALNYDSIVLNTNYINNNIDSIYNQIHIIKKYHDVGFISQKYETTIEVWNAFNTANTLTSNSITEDGVYLYYNNSEIVYPMLFPANSSKIFNLEVEIEGAYAFDSTFTFSFSGLTASGEIKGLRAFLFDFKHNWVTQFVEGYSYNTEINKSITSAEQRFSFSDLTRYSCNYSYRLNKIEKQKFTAIMYNNINVVYSLPLYIYSMRTRLQSNINSDTLFVYDLKDSIMQPKLRLMLKNTLTSLLEIVEIESIDMTLNTIKVNKPLVNTIDENTQVVPIISARIIENPNETRETTDISSFSLTFLKEDDDIDMLHVNNDDIIINKIDDINYMEITPDKDLQVNVEYNPNRISLSNNNSKVEYFKYQDFSEVKMSFDHIMHKKEHFSYLKKIYKLQEGRYQDLYLMNFNSDVKIIRDISINDTVLVIQNINASTFYKDKKIKYLNIRVGLSWKRVEILDIYKIDDDSEAIVLKNNFGYNLDHTFINYAAFLFLGRLDSDDLIIRYTTDRIGDTTINFLKNVDI